MHMSEIKNINIVGILGVLGAVLVVACVFLEWGSIVLTLIGENIEHTFSGWDLYSDKAIYSDTVFEQKLSIHISDLEITSYDYVPLVALVCGVIGIIATIIPVALNGRNIGRILGIVALILAIVSVVLMALYMTDLSYSGGIEGVATVTVEASYGVYVGIVGAVLMILGGIGDIMRKAN